MPVTAESFLASNTCFDGRRSAAVQAAIDEAAKQFDAGVCGELYDALVEAQARVILLGDPNGLPTSATGESGMIESARERVEALKRLVPVRGLGTGLGTAAGRGWFL
jgi:hypothetical protein